MSCLVERRLVEVGAWFLKLKFWITRVLRVFCTTSVGLCINPFCNLLYLALIIVNRCIARIFLRVLSFGLLEESSVFKKLFSI